MVKGHAASAVVLAGSVALAPLTGGLSLVAGVGAATVANGVYNKHQKNRVVSKQQCANLRFMCIRLHDVEAVQVLQEAQACEYDRLVCCACGITRRCICSMLSLCAPMSAWQHEAEWGAPCLRSDRKLLLQTPQRWQRLRTHRLNRHVAVLAYHQALLAFCI